MRARLVASLVCLAMLWVAPVLADYGPLWTDGELASLSRVVVVGRVTSVETAWDIDGSAIYTYVGVAVARQLRGPVLPATIVVKQMGGVVGSVGLYVGGQPAFAVGEEVLLFLEARPRDGTLYTAAGWQGKWSIAQRDGVAVATRSAGLSMRGNEIAPEQRLLGELERAAQAAPPLPTAVLQPLPPEAPAPSGFITPRTIAMMGFAWHEAWDRGKVGLRFHSTRQPGVGTGKRQFKNSAKRWTAIAGTINFLTSPKKFKGTAPGEAFRGADATLLLQNLDPLGEIDDGGSVLAQGGAWFYNGPVVNDAKPATSGFLVTNDSSAAIAFMKKKPCYENVVAHELGHAVGIGHTDVPGNLMYPSVNAATCNAGPIALGEDDRAGWKQLYDTSLARR